MQFVKYAGGGGGGSGNDKGYFLDEAALIAAYPTGQAGRYAILGSTDSVWVWDDDTSAWVDSGVSSSAFLKLDQTTPQSFTGGTVAGSGLLNVTSGELGLDTNTYITSIDGQNLSTADNSISQFITQGDIDRVTNVPAYESDPLSLHLDQTTQQTVINNPLKAYKGFQYETAYSKTGTEAAGTRFWDSEWDTTSLVLPDGVILQDGQELHRKVYNDTLSTIPNGTVVYQSGSFGEFATIGLADASDDVKNIIIGVTTQDILSTDYGKVTVIGLVHGVDTHLYAENTTLYLSDTTPGAWTATPPAKAIPIAVVQKSDATDGAVYVNFAQPGSLDALTDVLVSGETAGQVLTWNGSKRVNGNPASASAGPGVNFYYDYTQVIGTGTENDNIVRSLSKAPTGAAESIIATTFAGAGTQFVCAFLDSTLGRTTIDAGAWTFNTYVNTTITGLGQTSNYSRTVSKVSTFGAYTLTTTGTGTTRTATISSSFFVAGDYNADMELTSYIQTPQGLYPIAGYTSGTVVTITVPTTYTNETGVSGYIWRKLFNFASPTITTTYPSVAVLTASLVESAFSILATDKLGVITFAHATTACTVRLYMDGNTHATFFNSPLITLHNDLATIQGGTATERYHLSAAEHTVATQTANGTRDGVLSSSDWTTFNDKVPNTRELTINGVTYDLTEDRSWTVAGGGGSNSYAWFIS